MKNIRAKIQSAAVAAAAAERKEGGGPIPSPLAPSVSVRSPFSPGPRRGRECGTVEEWMDDGGDLGFLPSSTILLTNNPT